ncbi:TIGR04255 family protein [Subtercola lobariae]|uniref:TIGR04255 family protein n=1 Tax=Subtercola lobariae TaxID=1588641 RepID=A0A917B1B7_9MICO|nr:TIGR04255 family protein [Subtercola lobariae]GGF11405.1 hypothetical protein GCM10011399_01570 [Subtercola lobariae]
MVAGNGLSRVPSFAHPPVTEAVVSVEFAPVAAIGFLFLGAFNQQIQAEFPRHEEMIFVPQTSTFAGFQPIQPVVRLRMITEDQSSVAQLQNDRLTLNWRQAPNGREYPHYAVHVAKHRELFDRLGSSVAGLGDEEVIPLIAESTYVNRIEFDAGEQAHEYFSLLTDGEALPGAHVATHFQTIRAVSSEDSRFGGHLTITAEPFAEPNAVGVILTVVTRIALDSADSLDATYDGLAFAHETSVVAFAAATTSEMHSRWGMEI